MAVQIHEYFHGSHYAFTFSEADVAQYSFHNRCPTCLADNAARVLIELGQSSWSRRVQLAQCENCDVVYYLNPPSSEFIEQFYQQMWNTRSGEVGDNTPPRKLKPRKRMAAILADLGYIKENAKILDLGCGTGDLLAGLHDAGFSDLWGTEMAPYRFRVSDERFPGRIFSGGYQNVPDDMRFDVIYSNHVLEHIPQPADAVDWIRSHLTEEGMMVLSVPDAWHEPVLNQVLFLPHLHSFSATSLDKLGGPDRRPVFWQNDRRWDITAVYPAATTPIVPKDRAFAGLQDLTRKVSGSQQRRIAEFLATIGDDPASYSLSMTYKSDDPYVRDSGFHRLPAVKRLSAKVIRNLVGALGVFGENAVTKRIADLTPYVSLTTAGEGAGNPVIGRSDGFGLFDLK